ncbi:MAG: hypothetical protein GY711_05855 [bacterium]|nr:hypothetical protein [bacterium]
MDFRLLSACGFALASSAAAQTTTQIALNYNFNGIVHAGEDGVPDDLAGYRSISDRGLSFAAGVPADPLLAPYSLVSTPGTLDIVHLGNRVTVDNGNWAFDLMPNGDDIGVQPTWLANVDQSGPQTTVVNPPIVLEASSRADFLYQISNGGGSFDVTFSFQSGGSTTASLSGGDWFGGIFGGTENVDLAALGANLSITEGGVNLSAHAGESITQISFENRSNTNAGYAILAANVFTDPMVLVDQQVALDYNFNGIVHQGEAGLPDDPTGYRSISDRGLDFSAGVPADPLLSSYSLVDQPGVLDIVHLGNRDTVSGGAWAFEGMANGNDIGIQPTWLPNVDQTGPQTTVLNAPVTLASASTANFLYQISDGGGSFDVTFGFMSGGSTTATLSGGDWFGGAFGGTDAVDQANTGANLSITEGSVMLGADAGETITSISFSNASNGNAGYAILAAKVRGTGDLGTSYCGPAIPNSSGFAGEISAVGSVFVVANNVTLNADQLPPGQFGYFLAGQTQGFFNPPGSQGIICLMGNIGRYNSVPDIIQGPSGSVAIDLTSIPVNPPRAAMAGETWNFQCWYRDVNPTSTSNFTDGVSITFQ